MTAAQVQTNAGMGEAHFHVRIVICIIDNYIRRLNIYDILTSLSPPKLHISIEV